MADTNSQPKHVYLVDGSGYIFRAYHALPPLTRADGTPVNAVLGFTSMLMKLISETDADHIAVIFDTARATFRNEIYSEYKANRPPPPEELIPQFPLIREATRAFNLPAIEMQGYEADDLIATYARLAKAAGADVTIVSSDKDLMQLISPRGSGDRVKMFDPIKNKPIGAAEVEEKFGVGPDKVVEVQALAGDSTDNVPGVPGIGLTVAPQLVSKYGGVAELLGLAPKQVETDLSEVQIKINDIAGCDVKISSAREIADVIANKLKVGGTKRDKKNEPTIDTEGLKELAGKGRNSFLKDGCSKRLYQRICRSFRRRKIANLRESAASWCCSRTTCPSIIRSPPSRAASRIATCSWPSSRRTSSAR